MTRLTAEVRNKMHKYKVQEQRVNNNVNNINAVQMDELA